MSRKLSRTFASLLMALAITLTGVIPASAAPPVNDDFDSAASIPALPFYDGPIDTSEATLAFGEPANSCEEMTSHSVWYSFTSTTGVPIEANSRGSNYTVVLSVYTGSWGDLTEIACAWDHGFQSHVRFAATPGTTYYFRVASYWGFGGNLMFSVEEYAPQQSPAVGIYVTLDDPSQMDTIQFVSDSYDPEHFRIESFVWDFGDGTTDTGRNVWHQYTADGDYTVQHTVTTVDGRSASTSQVVQVRTHDVAITKIRAPVAAKAWQIRPITVSVKNLRYDGTVSVDLYKRGPDGDEWIGSSSQFVPMRSGNRTTAFTFNYTFEDSDAKAGEITFYAIAFIQDTRDAFPENNEATASTRVH